MKCSNKHKTKGREWIPAEDEFLRANYPIRPTSFISESLGRSVTGIYGRVAMLGVRKSPEYLREQNRMSYKRLVESGKAHRFAPGHTPKNKGEKMSKEAYEKLRHTFFKKGHVPANHKPVGYERINRDGYVEVKVAEPNKFRAKHRIVWEECFGPIPAGHNVQFRDGNRRNLNPENLYLISRSEQLGKENSMYARYPEELQRAIHAKGALQRQINKLKKDE